VCDEWMPPLELTINPEQFHHLPRHPAYRYEYHDGLARLSPRPRYYHALLDLTGLGGAGGAGSACAAGELALRPIASDDWEALALVFAAAFRQQQPFCGLAEGQRQEAARRSLEQTRSGGDGPWLEQASFQAVEDGKVVGGLVPTLLPEADPIDPDSYYWPTPPPPDCLARRIGRPHLTWIFVEPRLAGRGVGTALLRAAARELLALGYRELASTFLLGNDSSMLWHWQAGFKLLPYSLSRRRPALLPHAPEESGAQE
jgi:GNAT superfamily N-acetyltransferase